MLIDLNRPFLSRGIGLTSSNGISGGSPVAVSDAVDKNDEACCGMNDDADPELLPLKFPLRAVPYDIISSICLAFVHIIKDTV